MGNWNKGFGIKIEVNESKRYRTWRKHGKVKKGKLEYMQNFDKRVYALGLKALKESKLLQEKNKELKRLKSILSIDVVRHVPEHKEEFKEFKNALSKFLATWRHEKRKG